MAEVYRVCDAVSVLRDGAHVATRATSSISEAELVQMMIGRPLSQYFPRPSHERAGDEVLARGAALCAGPVPGRFVRRA